MNMKLINNVSLGADPEMFLFSPAEQRYVPVCGKVGGTKKKPLPITDEGHAIQEDGCAIEFCIPPSKTVGDFVSNIIFVKNYIDNNVLLPLGLQSACVPSARFTKDDLKSRQARTFGCDPDYNAWTNKENIVGRPDPLYRCAGGHIHIGYDDHNIPISIELIKAMDLFLGVPSVLLDSDVERRQMYGSAGSYRIKPAYGVEYRVLSNFWIDTPQFMEWAWEGTMRAIDFVNDGGIITNPGDIQKCINQGLKELASEILDDYNINIVELQLTN
jgi:hypothetical protein